MGSIRYETKLKPLLNEEEYAQYLNILDEARNAAEDNHVFWDLEEGENVIQARKNFLHIASKEGITVSIRRERGSKSLAFRFKQERAASTRMTADECQQRIMAALTQAERPLQKAEIIHSTGISPSTWNIRIKELMKDGKVVRKGVRRDTKYCLAR